jgi:two-component system sensor kinase
VSHDLRSPLRAIHGFTKILTEDYKDKLDEEGYNILSSIIKSAEKMSQLIEDLLNFSKLGKKEINKKEIKMGELFENLFKELKEKDRIIEFRLTHMPVAKADRNLIEQVAINLLSNAIKFTRKKENAIIEVGGKTGDNENIYWVKDNGVGFDMKYSDKLFGVFQRLHSSEEFEGTGVGLPIVQRIIHKHGGKTWAEANLDSGATFFFTLPDENI